MNHAIAGNLETSMIHNPETTRRCLNLLLICRCIERVADHAKNIAEDVYYLYRAQDIRHERSIAAA